MSLSGQPGEARPHTESSSPGLSPGGFYYLHASSWWPQFGGDAASYFSLSARWSSAFEARQKALYIFSGAEGLPACWVDSETR